MYLLFQFYWCWFWLSKGWKNFEIGAKGFYLEGGYPVCLQKFHLLFIHDLTKVTRKLREGIFGMIFTTPFTQNENWNNCLDINGQSLARCIYNCKDDESYEADCVGQFKLKTEDCPCEVSKQWQIFDFKRIMAHNLWASHFASYFVLQENCKGGCPCDSYECNGLTTTIASTTSIATTTTAQSTKEAVLLLSTFSSNNVLMVIDFQGRTLIINVSLKFLL